MAIQPYKRRNRKNVKPVGRRLSREEVRTLRYTVETKARHDAKAIRDRAILDTMLFAALRRFEVANLATSSFVQDGGRWWIVLSVTKGDMPRRVKVHDVLYKSLAAWCDLAGLELGKDDKPLFYNLTKGGNFTGNGKRRVLSASVVGRLVTEYGHLSGLAPEGGKNALAAHDLRRTCARNAYDRGATVLQVQALLGHSDPKTTIRYIGALDDEENTAVDMVNYER
jgi:integrase